MQWIVPRSPSVVAFMVYGLYGIEPVPKLPPTMPACAPNAVPPKDGAAELLVILPKDEPILG